MEQGIKLLALNEWGLGTEKPLVIAGPCSAESRRQVLETAEMLKNSKVRIFRAGIWKPRTRPGTFEGVGSSGLEWLKEVREKFGFLIATEVANVKHVYTCLRAGIDVLWIGSRTTVNPFAVQEIADSLKGVDIPVMIKNPIHPDIDLWIGGIERLNKAGICRIAAVHRGVALYEKTLYRNPPCWELPIELKRRLPSLPMICDPSHICGSVDMIPDISQKAIDLDFDGLMLESHAHPELALSDAAQQLQPAALHVMIEKLNIRSSRPEHDSAAQKLEALRRHIDQLDKELIATLSQRMKVSKDIGVHKKNHNITVLQTGRWEELVNNRIGTGSAFELGSDFIMKLFKEIHLESINKQTEIMKGEKTT